jgi:hypothetical protein
MKMEKEALLKKGGCGCETAGVWEPPAEVSREEIIHISHAVVAQPDIKIKRKEDIFRIRVLEMEWDIGVMLYEPEDPSKIPAGPDGKKIGIFMLHGGAGDYRVMEPFALMLAGKFGYKVASMTYPGRLYLLDSSRNWPGDTVYPDGSVRTPIWKRDEVITKDQYEVVEDRSKRERYGTLIKAKAKEGTTFYYRVAAWPVAFEEGMNDICWRHFPAGGYSIYVTGHSTGGPYAFNLSQRVPNVAGVVGMESDPFGYINSKMVGQVWDTWDSVRIRTWRDIARYAGPEALGEEGPDALNHLPRLMEDVFNEWEKGTTAPLFKVEDIIQFNGEKPLREAARVTARRLGLGPQETEALVERYLGYLHELSGAGVKPVPPLFLGIAKVSSDHAIEKYHKFVLPMVTAMKPAPKARVIQFQAGVHFYYQPERDLPFGLAPAVATAWNDAIMGGYFMK